MDSCLTSYRAGGYLENFLCERTAVNTDGARRLRDVSSTVGNHSLDRFLFHPGEAREHSTGAVIVAMT